MAGFDQCLGWVHKIGACAPVCSRSKIRRSERRESKAARRPTAFGLSAEKEARKQVSAMEADIEDPNPDIHDLFCHYNALYFDDSLGACIVSWTPRRMNFGGGCEILLSEPLLKSRPSSDLKNTLLHEMIHAYLGINNKNKSHSDHGPSFQKLMNEINSSSVTDGQRPYGGYNITTNHSFNDEVVHYWQCQSCGDLFKRAMNREPSVNDCIAKHQMSCPGSYKKLAEPPDSKDKRKVSKGMTELEGQNLEVSTQSTRRSVRRAYIEEGNKDKSDALKLNSMENVYPTVRDVNENAASHSQSIDDKLDNSFSSKANEQTVEEATQDHAAPATAERSTIFTWSRKRKPTCVASKRSRKLENDYTVIINSLNWYANEEDEENIEPLHNKRTERRIKQRLLKNPTHVNTELQAMDDPSCMRTDGEIDLDLLNSGKKKPRDATEGHPQQLLVDVNVRDDHVGKGLHACDQLDADKTSQECVVRSPFHVSRTLSVDGHDGCGKAVSLDGERDDFVDLIDDD
ncbi:hypothetical protein ACLOJK_023734 [Asimina triloba]